MLQKKKTWKVCENEEILRIYEEVKAEAERLFPEYFKGCTYEFYIDGTKNACGHCYWEYDKDTIYNNYGKKNHFGFLRCKHVVITLSKYMCAKYARNTIVHEFGHAVTPAENHSELWLKRANKIGEKWGENCAIGANPDKYKTFNNALPVAPYRIACPECGRSWEYHRMGKAVKYSNLYTCPDCGSNLVRVK